MKKLIILFILSITAFCSRLEASGPPEAWSEADLASMFGSGARQLPTPRAMPPAAQQIPSVRPALDLEAFCSGKEVCYLDAYFAASATDKSMPEFIQDLYEIFSNYAQPLNNKENDALTKGLAGLNETELGRVTCQGLTKGACTLESLAANGVIVQAKDMGSDVEAVTLMYAGKVLVVVNRNPQYDTKKPLEWGVTLGHEMSHAEDYKKFRRGLNDNYRADTNSANRCKIAALRHFKGFHKAFRLIFMHTGPLCQRPNPQNKPSHQRRRPGGFNRRGQLPRKSTHNDISELRRCGRPETPIIMPRQIVHKQPGQGYPGKFLPHAFKIPLEKDCRQRERQE